MACSETRDRLKNFYKSQQQRTPKETYQCLFLANEIDWEKTAFANRVTSIYFQPIPLEMERAEMCGKFPPGFPSDHEGQSAYFCYRKACSF